MATGTKTETTAAASDIDVFKRLKTDDELRAWLWHVLRLKFPAKGVCVGHDSPFEYVRHAYFEPSKDVVVWAPRGGGKTRLGAAATLLDLLHKPGVAVRILGGSLEQSLRMWEHLLPDVTRHAEDRISGKIGARSVRLDHGGSCGVVTQSQRAVRGLRVQKLRCDEVEMFDADVWEAAQLVTRTLARRAAADDAAANPNAEPPPAPGADPATDPADDDPGAPDHFAGVVEAFSTFHRTGGVMERVIENANARDTRVIKWCLMEVLEKCPPTRHCPSCPLFEDCNGRAKEHCDGFLPIDDAIRMKARVSKETWDAEMLCRRPSRRGCVFATFAEEAHVVERLPAPPPHALEAPGGGAAGLYLGIDFGFRNPFVCLWIRRDRFGRSFVVDEYVKSEIELDAHLAEIKSRYEHGPVRRVGCDPAGSARNEHTGVSSVAKLRDAGFAVSHRKSHIADGLEKVRLGLRSAAGETTLYIHPRCKQLIRAMRQYRYGEHDRAETPVKDGPDHLVDALRYYYVTRDLGESGKADY